MAQEPITLLLGPRQCGKTTLAQYFYGRADTHWFDLQNLVHRGRLEDDPILTLGPLRGLVVLDEVQVAPNLFPALRVLADRRESTTRFLLLGSASPRLVKHASETLAGRVHRVEITGFVGSEVGTHLQETLWLRGGFPDSFKKASDESSLKWRRDFIHDFLQRDLPALAESRLSPQQLWKLLLLLAGHHGACINASSVGRDLGVDFKTVQRYLDVLEGAYVVRILPAFSENVPKRVRKAPKLYFRDSGILHALLGYETAEQVETSGRMGFSWEGFCIEHVIHELDIPAEYCAHYSVQSGAEMDLVVSLGGFRLGFEFMRGGVPQITKSMHTAAEDLKLDRVFLVYPGSDTFHLERSGRFKAVCWQELAKGRRILNL